MSDGIVTLNPGVGGAKVDTSTIVVGANTVVRERANLSDPTDPNGHAKVSNTSPTGAEYGVVVRSLIAPTVSAVTNPTTIGLSAIRVDTGLALRKSVEIQNRASNAAKNVYVGFSNAVTSSVSGRELAQGASITFELSEAIQIWVIATQAGMVVDCTEVA